MKKIDDKYIIVAQCLDDWLVISHYVGKTTPVGSG